MESIDPNCELCEAAPITERYYEDDLCWVAECESCFVPMVVWKHHDPNPPEEVRAVLIERLLLTVEQLAPGGDAAASSADERRSGSDPSPVRRRWFVDDRLRSIPTHYHAHARRRM